MYEYELRVHTTRAPNTFGALEGVDEKETEKEIELILRFTEAS